MHAFVVTLLLRYLSAVLDYPDCYSVRSARRSQFNSCINGGHCVARGRYSPKYVTEFLSSAAAAGPWPRRCCRAGARAREYRARNVNINTQRSAVRRPPSISWRFGNRPSFAGHNVTPECYVKCANRERVLVRPAIVKLTNMVKFGLWNCRSIGEDGAPALCDCISSNDFDFFAAVETWHDSASDPSHCVHTVWLPIYGQSAT